MYNPKRPLYFLIATIMTMMACMPSQAMAQKETFNDLKEELSTISEKLQKNNKQIKEKQKEKRSVQQSLGGINRELRVLELRLKQRQRELEVVVHKEEKTKQSLEKAEDGFEQKKEILNNRLRQVYKNQHMGFLEFLLSPRDLMSVLDSQYYFERIMKKDLALVEETKAVYTGLVEAKQELEVQKNKIRSVSQTVAMQEKSLSRKKDQKSRYLSQLERQIAKMEEETEALENASNQLTSFIVSRGRSSDAYLGTNRMIKPVEAWLSSRFGYRRHPIFKRQLLHRGVDFGARQGTPIKASDSGVVIVAGTKDKYRGYGIVTVIDHGRRPSDGKHVSTLYAHQSRLLVQEGDFVTKGKVIGLVGSTGFSTGPHLHFEIRLNGVPVDPLPFIN